MALPLSVAEVRILIAYLKSIRPDESSNSKDEERQLCSVSDLSTCIFHRSSGRKLGLSIDAAEIITLDLSWARSSELIIAASSGRRVEIRE